MKSILIIGLGRFGSHLCLKFSELGHDVLACDSNEAAVKRVMNDVTGARVADCTDESVVEQLGVSNFDQCYVCIGSDLSASLMVTALLRDHGAKFICAKAASEIHAKLLTRTGADEIYYPEKDSAERLAVRMGSDSIFDCFELGQDFNILELSVPERWVGHSLRELDIRSKWNLNILAVKDAGGVRPIPNADYQLNREEHLLALGKQEDFDRLLRRVAN